MVTKLFVPDRRIVVPKPPSYVKLDMAFAIGSGAKLMDKSRYRSHGTISGADWADGAHGKCLDFDRTVPDYVEIPAAYTQLNFTSEDFSLIARVKADDISVYPFVFARGLTSTDGYEFYIRANGTIRFRTCQAAANQETTSTASGIVIATWYTIGFSREGTAVSLFINGVEDTDVAGTHINPKTSTRSAKIGVWNDKVDAPFDGKIEFLRVFGGIALPASAHLAYHNALA